METTDTADRADRADPAVTLQLTVDCADPRRLVTFWCEALGYVPEPPPGGHTTWREYWQEMGVPEDELAGGAGETPESITDPAGRGPRMWFQKVPEPKTVKNRVHLDLKAGGGRGVPLAERRRRVEEKVAGLVAAGAAVLRTMDEPGTDYYGVVLRDPEGNEFCVA
ncbi:VOC family protein [Streptomyces sp. TRM 70361]|uniref:VOC family protein n=1 Tax=Streptomyces sp. TRM 70361 TaxID=3116553 RepID=UPI002E7BE5A9|nr:VOC family protein [Streptomyces sp. TRM 70361]MEE1938184.1 VOC family protein [Streptomyces sp. TRM 70361]